MSCGTATLSVYGSSANSVAGDAVLTNGGNSRTHIVSFGGTRQLDCSYSLFVFVMYPVTIVIDIKQGEFAGHY